ncbi:hypothetical protein YC2023_008805 [Brassica napus]
MREGATRYRTAIHETGGEEASSLNDHHRKRRRLQTKQKENFQSMELNEDQDIVQSLITNCPSEPKQNKFKKKEERERNREKR